MPRGWHSVREKEQDHSSHLGPESPTITVTGIGRNPIMSDGDFLFHPTSDSAPVHWPDYQSKWPPGETLTTSASTITALPERSDTPTTSDLDLLTGGHAFPSESSADSHGSYPDYKDESRHGPPIAVAAVVPIAALAIIGAVVFLCMRKRRKQKHIAAAQAQVQEMKSRSLPTVQAYVASPLPPAGPLSSPTIPTSPQPVILGPISGSNNNYFTGIDISDIMSVRSNERTGLGDPFADSNSFSEEPPPPYYPRSIAPLSRDTSLRMAQLPPSASSQTGLIGAGGQSVRSPFDDPRDNDAVSDVSGRTLRQDRDDMSAVSDMSYQQDSVVGSPSM